MPELPDITVYLEAIGSRVLGQRIEDIRLNSPFLLRTVSPPLAHAKLQTVIALRRIGKRFAIGLSNDHWLVIHLMIAGRLHWKKAGVKLSGRYNLAAFDFPNGSLVLTEAGTQRRASLHVFESGEAMRAIDPGGIEPLEASLEDFSRAVTATNHTLKRILTDPHLISGVGNAYSDEILHKARLSPIALSQKLTAEEIQRLYVATRESIIYWIDRLRAEAAGSFPENVTAFRDGMAVHGKYGKPCPICGLKVQRIRYATNETNYCPGCQTGGKVLADRALSRLLGKDWSNSPKDHNF